MRRAQFSPLLLALALFGVAAVTFVCSRVLPVNASTAGFFYIMLVLAVATIAGLTEAIAASVASMLCYNFFFLPPVGRFTIAEPQNWVALATFLTTALVASHLSDRAKKQALEAKRRQRETEQLYSLSRSILLTDASQPIGSQAAQHIAQIFDSNAVVLYDSPTGGSFVGGSGDLEGIEPLLKQAVVQGVHHRDESRDVEIWPITLGGQPIGALAAQRMRLSDGAVQALLNLVAIALERVRTEEAANRAEVARQSEEFKSTLLDAIAHEFKTPLTSIKAASTSMLAGGSALAPEQRELASIIDEEADRLSLLVTEAVKMSEIDAGKVKLQRAAVSVDGLFDAAISTFSGRGDDRIRRLPAPDLPRVFVDPEMIGLALRQLIDNALKYSPPSAVVELSAEEVQARVVISVVDTGPGVPQRDREKIFDKFYRRSSVRNKVPGSGLGLHIAREIARTHGGDLWMDLERETGSQFNLALPISPEPAK
jgi:two-component system, OmpR family, sensor histidine kinase KdpD